MNTATDSGRTDEAMIAYVEWLQLSAAEQDDQGAAPPARWLIGAGY